MQVESSEKTVAIGWVRAIVATASAAGVDETRLLAHCRIGVLPADPLARIGLDEVVLLWRAAAELTDDPAFGLRMGHAVRANSFNVIPYIMVSSSTLREAFSHLQAFQRLVSDGARLHVLEHDGMAWLVFHPVEATLRFAPLQTEAVLACALGLLRWIIGPTFTPTRICMVHPRISPPAVYRALLDCVTEFSCDFNGIGFPLALLDALLPARNPELCSLHASLARRHLLSLVNSANTRTRVIAALEQMLAHGMVQREQVAAILGMSARNLQQRLAAEGTSFAETLDEVRHRMALDYIADPMLGMAQIADLLNFSDTSAFYRAFKRWTGGVPGDHRRQSRDVQA